MTAPTLVPQVAAPGVAEAAVDRDLARILAGRSIEQVGWRRPDPRTLLVPMRGFRHASMVYSYGFDPAAEFTVQDVADGPAAVDPVQFSVGDKSDATSVPPPDDYLLRLHFSHYPQSPPSAQFVNPDTLRYDRAVDVRWLPKLQNSNEVSVHADYSGIQLVCCSSTLEFYDVHHGVEPRHQWRPGSSFAQLLNTLSRHLRPPYYDGRQGT